MRICTVVCEVIRSVGGGYQCRCCGIWCGYDPKPKAGAVAGRVRGSDSGELVDIICQS